MSFQSKTLVIRQYLYPLTPDQLRTDYVHTLPSGRKAVNLKSLKRWRSLPVGTAIVRVLPVERKALASSQPSRPAQLIPSGLWEEGILSINKTGFWVQKHISLPVSGFDYIGTAMSATGALTQLNRALSARNQNFPMPSHYHVS